MAEESSLRPAMLALLTASPTTPGFYRRAHTYLDKEQILAYDPSAGSYSVLQMIRDLQHGCQTFNPMPLQRGSLPPFRKHAYLGDERLLEVDPQTGDFRVLSFNRTVPCLDMARGAVPTAFGDVVQSGRLAAFVDADVVTSLGQDEVLIQSRAAASYSIRMYDRNADLPPPQAYVEAQAYHALAPGEAEFGQPFPGLPVASGSFKRPVPQSLMYAGKGLLLGYTAGGGPRPPPPSPPCWAPAGALLSAAPHASWLGWLVGWVGGRETMLLAPQPPGPLRSCPPSAPHRVLQVLTGASGRTIAPPRAPPRRRCASLAPGSGRATSLARDSTRLPSAS